MNELYKVNVISKMGGIQFASKTAKNSKLSIIKNKDGSISYFKTPRDKESVHSMISERFHTLVGGIIEREICGCGKKIGQLVAEYELAEFDGKCGVISKNFSTGGNTYDVRLAFPHENRFLHNPAYNMNWLQALDLRTFCEEHLKACRKDFQDDFIRRWILSFYFGNKDMINFQNLSFESLSRNFHGGILNENSVKLDPLWDFARCEEFYRRDVAQHYSCSLKQIGHDMDWPIHYVNLEYLVEKYPEVTKEMFGALLSLREGNKGKFEEICCFSSAADYCRSFWKNLTRSEIKVKLSHLGDDIKDAYDKRIDLTMGNCL